jgi:hypothetical protein
LDLAAKVLRRTNQWLMSTELDRQDENGKGFAANCTKSRSGNENESAAGCFASAAYALE